MRGDTVILNVDSTFQYAGFKGERRQPTNKLQSSQVNMSVADAIGWGNLLLLFFNVDSHFQFSGGSSEASDSD